MQISFLTLNRVFLLIRITVFGLELRDWLYGLYFDILICDQLMNENRLGYCKDIGLSQKLRVQDPALAT